MIVETVLFSPRLPAESFPPQHCSGPASVLFLLRNLLTGILCLHCTLGAACHADELSLPAGFLQQHCIRCHSGDQPSGGLLLRAEQPDLSHPDERARWVLLHDRVAAGEMPPEGTLPDPAVRTRFLETLSALIIRSESGNSRTILRRMNREEYQHTVCDLFGITVDLRTILPDEAADHGFDTIGSGQAVSTEQMLLYLDAADAVLDEVFGPAQAPKPQRTTVNFRDLRSADTADRVDADGVVLFSGAKSLPLYGVAVRGPAAWRLTFEAMAIQTDRPVVMQVEGGVTGRIPGHVAGFVELPPDKLTRFELIDRAVEGSDTFAFRLVGGFPWWSVKAEEYGGAGIFLGDITIEGPLEPWPRPSRLALFGGIDEQRAVAGDLRRILARLLPRAFRRPVADSQLDHLTAIGAAALADGQAFPQALRKSLKAMLCTAEFLYFEEPTAESAGPAPAADLIDSYALANRLSYFLWSSLPDAELLEVAATGSLTQPALLRAQAERLLQDDRANRFVQRFTDQWLRLRDIDFTVPNDQLYPEYNQLLRQSMLDESRAFFREVLQQNLSINTFIQSDFAMLNRPLAEFYGIEGVSGLQMQRVPLPPGSLRGGVLSQAAVLKVSADGTRTSPVLRGAWILKHLYGTPAAPPPPGVAAVEPDIRGATTIRQQLEKHRSDQSCNRCHNRIDPPGFALECFDVIGGERQWYRVAQGGRHVSKPLHPQAPGHHVRYQQGGDVDPSGLLPDGRPFADLNDYRQLLLSDPTALPLAMTRLLTEYGTGRRMTFSDRGELQQVIRRTAGGNYGLRDVVLEIICSPLFCRQ